MKWRTMSRLHRRPHWSPCLKPLPNSASNSNSTDLPYCCRNATPGWHKRNSYRRSSRFRTLVLRTIVLSKTQIKITFSTDLKTFHNYFKRKRRITFDMFVVYLQRLCDEKGLDLEKTKVLMIECGLPGAVK